MKSILRKEYICKNNAAFRRARVEFYTAKESYHTIKKIYNDMKKKVKLNTSGLNLLAELHKKLIEDRSWYYESMSNLNRVAISAFYRSPEDVATCTVSSTPLKYVLHLKKAELDQFISALVSERAKASSKGPDDVLEIEIDNENLMRKRGA